MKPNWTTILLLAVAVLGTILVMSLFRKGAVSEKMIRNEERLKYLEQDRVEDSIQFQQRIVWYDSALSASNSRYNDLENKKQPIRNAIKKVDNTVDNFDKEQLRRASAAHFDQYH